MHTHNSNLRSSAGLPDLLSFPETGYSGINDVDNLAAPRVLGSSKLRGPFLNLFNMRGYSCRTVERGARRRSLPIVALRREPCSDQESQNGRTNSAA